MHGVPLLHSRAFCCRVSVVRAREVVFESSNQRRKQIQTLDALFPGRSEYAGGGKRGDYSYSIVSKHYPGTIDDDDEDTRVRDQSMMSGE